MSLNKALTTGVLVVLIGAGAAVYIQSSANGTGVTAAAQDSANAGQEGRVQAVARRVLIDHWQIGMPDAVLGADLGKLSPNGRPVSAPSAISRPAALAPASQAAAAASRTRANFAMDLAHAKPDFAAREELALKNVTAALADPRQRLLGSGVSKMTFSRTMISGDHATVEGTMTSWSRFQLQNSDGSWIESSPAGDDQFTVELEQVGGKWFVTNYVGHPVDGSMP
ncbi:hypothetical protein GCM10027053_12170 [Intrasporangium mesophilum]